MLQYVEMQPSQKHRCNLRDHKHVLRRCAIATSKQLKHKRLSDYLVSTFICHLPRTSTY